MGASSALAVNNAADSTSSPGPATSTGSSSVGQHHSVQQQAQQQQQQQQTAFNLAATNAFAAQQMPPGYAYYFGNQMGMSLQGYPQTPQGHVYQPQAMTVPGAGTTPSQFQKQTYGTSYGSGYDTWVNNNNNNKATLRTSQAITYPMDSQSQRVDLLRQAQELTSTGATL